jgi:pantothenate kinase-related protein Tda10
MAGPSQIYNYIDFQWTPSPWTVQPVIYDAQQEDVLRIGQASIDSPTRATPDRLLCLFHGPTGTGKSTFAKYFAKTLDLSIYNVIPSLDNHHLKARIRDYSWTLCCSDRRSGRYQTECSALIP